MGWRITKADGSGDGDWEILRATGENAANESFDVDNILTNGEDVLIGLEGNVLTK
jgi:hypothetical protein